MIDVREASYFVAVAEELHFGRAAARLHMSQPPLSQAIRALERRLEVDLLHRTTRSVHLTIAGSALLHECRRLLAAARAAEETARRAAGGAVGELRVGAVTSAFADLLPDLLDRHHHAFPEVVVTLDEIDTNQAVESLRLRRHDVVIGRLLGAPADLRQVVVDHDEFVLASPRRWPAPESLEETAALPWVRIPRTISPDYHDQVAACCRAAGFAPQERHTARSIASQLVMVGAGLGVALVPARLARGHDRVRVRRLEHVGAALTELTAVYRADGDPVVEGFVALARDRPAPS